MATEEPHLHPQQEEPGTRSQEESQSQPAGSKYLALHTMDAERVCRVCLREASLDGEELHFIFEDAPVEEGANLARILDECTLHQCQRHDGMPPHMCGSCVEAARHAYRFKRHAERSYCSLVALLGRSPQLKTRGAEAASQTDQVALLPCEMCHDQFLNSLELRLHRNQVHRTTKEGTGSGTGGPSTEGTQVEEFKCKFCPQHFPHLRQLRSHLARSHEQTARLQCAHCQRTFSRRDHLLRHMRNQHRDVEEDLLRTWPAADDNTMQSDGGDELVSAEVLLNEEDDEEDGLDAFKCNTNPISSNEDEDEEGNVANQTLWLHIKPEPCLEAEEVDLAMQLKLEKKRRRREKAEAPAEGSIDRTVKNEPIAISETQFSIKEESHLVGSEDEAMAMEDFMKLHVGGELPLSEGEFVDDESDLDDDEDDDEDGGEDDDGEFRLKEEPLDGEKPLKKSKSGRRRRRNKQSEPNPENRCEVCQRTFSRHCHLLRHKLSHLEKKPHNCPHCPKAFARSDHLKAHVQSLHSNKEHKCELCEAAFSRLDSLERHKVSKHNGEGLEPGSELKLQLAEHTCEYCSKRFSSKTYLRKHTLLHTDFLYACKTCEETFRERAQLREHEKTHTGQRNFLCCICGDSFARNDYLRVHMRRHNGEKPYKCRYCVKAFPRATDLKVHERYHTGTKPNLCNTCGKSFHRAYNLTIHMRTHTGERPYKCDQCPKSFTQSNDLKAHIRRHTGERYKCPHCDAYFLQLYNMRNHCLSVHNKHIETKTGRLQRTGLLDDGGQSHLTTVVMPPARYQPGMDPLMAAAAAAGGAESSSSTTVIHSPGTYNATSSGLAPGVSSAAPATTLDGASFAPTAVNAVNTAAPFGAFNFPPVVMAHLMYNHGGSSQHSQSGSDTGK
ncbi:LOW QUALITY PROTEIN: zinc finger protein 420 [Drosophila gunungcola]|uniref:LOW QUALITY PROTEIN: zinc finger protein 420 n=1 Tax=Drosophila gunungcola TaxID=103775 RepID=UPI0022DFEC3A|nr:LOW QUALITY PROTEIN: zinc finger protein 420 [Drosophila gunungcola]